MLLTPNVTKLCRPMDQGVIAALKNYCFNLMENLVEEDTIYVMTKPWDAVKQTWLICAWYKSLRCDNSSTADFRNVNDDNIKELIGSDKNDPGFEYSLTRNFT